MPAPARCRGFGSHQASGTRGRLPLWHASGVRKPAGGRRVRWCRCARPPAKFWEPSGFKTPRSTARADTRKRPQESSFSCPMEAPFGLLDSAAGPPRLTQERTSLGHQTRRRRHRAGGDHENAQLHCRPASVGWQGRRRERLIRRLRSVRVDRGPKDSRRDHHSRHLKTEPPRAAIQPAGAAGMRAGNQPAAGLVGHEPNQGESPFVVVPAAWVW